MLNRTEPLDAVLARNLVAARIVVGLTQQELVKRSDISRATIAQIETGSSDPRLSTIAHLARAIGMPPTWLLADPDDVRAIVGVLETPGPENGFSQLAKTLPPSDMQFMMRLHGTGMLKDRLRVAMIGAGLAKKLGGKQSAELCAAVFSGMLPGPGTVAGFLLGQARDQREAR